MNLSRFSVSRPVFTTMVVLIIIILGLISLRRLPIDLVPDITYPTLNIYTTYENASPEEIEELITRPVEEAVSAVPGVEQVISFSIEGRSTVRVSFSWGTDLDVAANDIRDRLDRTIVRLPEGVDRPILRKYDPTSFPIIILGAYGDIDMMELRRTVDDKIKYRIERIRGVAALDVWGGLEREIHVNLHADKVKATGLSLDHIIGQIAKGNINIPGGTVQRGNLEVIVRTLGEYSDIDELRNTVIAIREGVPVQLKKIASVEESWKKVTRLIRINGVPGVRIAVMKQSDANTVNVAKRVLEEVKRINQDIPYIRLVPMVDTSSYIQRSITNVGTSVLYGGALAVFILLFFLRNLRSTVIIATAIPISVVASFALMYFGGFTLNIMTLGGLALGVGMMVDSAIVVLENIYRLRESGKGAEEAAVRGSEEVTSAIIAGTLTTLAVFIPLIFIRGMTGAMLKQLAYIVSFSLLCSLFVALTLVPMLSARLLLAVSPSLSSSKRERGDVSLTGMLKNFYSKSENLFNRLENGYKYLLHFSLSHRLLIIAGAVLLFGGSLLLIPLVGVEFMPQADEGEVRVYIEMGVGTRLDLLGEKFRVLEDIVQKEVPEARTVMTTLGPSGWRGGGSHTGELRISLKPQSERKRTSEDIAASLRKKLSSIPGVKVRTRSVQELFALRLIAGEAEERVQIDIQGYDMQKADELAGRIKGVVEEIDGVTDVRLSREAGGPEELIAVDRQRAADMKLTVSEVANKIQTVLTGTVAGYYREAGDEIAIRVKLKDAEQMSLNEILNLTLANTEGEQIVLGNVVKVVPRTGPMRIDRKNQERLITVSANISGRDVGSVLSDIKDKLGVIQVPPDFSVGFGGEYEEQQKAFRELLLGFVLALILVYMVMASLYESLRHPFVVMFSVPLAAIGVVLILLLTDTTFNMQSYIGCIMLGGIVVNNAIILVDYINLLRRRDGMPLREAVEEAGRRRLRPILMTTMTTVIALSPLALGLGEGGESQAPLARAVIGGLLSSSFITLVFIPVAYCITEELKGRKGVLICLAFSLPAYLSTPTVVSSASDAPEAIRTVILENNAGQGETPPPERVMAITVEDAILLTLENNRSLKIERINPSIMKTYEEGEEAAFDPVISGEIGISRGKEQKLSTSGSIYERTTTSTDTVLSVSSLFPTGTRIGVDLSVGRLYSNLSPDHHTSRIGLTVTQALLQGRDIDVNLASIRQRRLDTEISRYELQGFAEKLIAEVETTYWDYYLAKRQIEIYQESLRLTEQQLTDTKERISAGVLAEAELAAAEAEMALHRQNLINARSNLKQTYIRLVRLMNPPGGDIWSRDVTLLDVPELPWVNLNDIESHVSVALLMRPDLNQAMLKVRQGEIEIVKTQNGLLPRMDFFITLGKSGYADSFSGSVETLDKGFYDVMAGISIELPLRNREARASHRRTLLSKEQAEEALGNLSQLIEVDIRTAFIEVNRTKEQITATMATRKFQEEKLRIETEKYKVGRSTMFMVAQAQRDLLGSQIAEAEALVNHLKALVELYRLEGTLLKRRGIALSENE